MQKKSHDELELNVNKSTVNLFLINKELKHELEKQKQFEAVIRERNGQIETLLYSLPVGIIIVDFETYKIVDANPQAILMIGMPKEQIVGSNYDRFFAASDEGKSIIFDEEQNNIYSNYILLTDGGEYLPIHKTKILETIDGREHFIECFDDISERKRTEQERIKKEKLQGIIEMSGAICHELNQPLQAVSGCAELLMMEISESEPIYRTLKIIKDQVDRMAEITKKLMSITKYET